MDVIKKIPILFFMLVVLSTSVFGLIDYNETGTPSGDFRTGTGFFNTELTGVNTAVRALTDARQTPLVTDLDGDGIREIIVLDSPNIRLYQNSTLSILDAFTLFADERMSNMITYDIDGDTFPEIIIVLEESDRLEILNWTGTTFAIETTINLSELNQIDGETMIKCGATNECLLVYSSDIDEGAGTNSISAIGFNSTAVGTSADADVLQTDVDDVFCLPKIRTMEYADYDNDATFEYIFSFIKPNQDVFIEWVRIRSNLSTVQELQNTIGGVTNTLTDQDDCVLSNSGRSFTSPLVFDIDGSSSNGEEAVVGYMLDADEFKMQSFTSTGANLDDYPEIFQADGVLVSNVMRANSFTDTGAVDFCVFGYAQDQNELDLLCASEQTGQIPETDEFVYDSSGAYNISFGYDDPWILITHAGQQSTVTTDGNNLDEFINSYGVFSLDFVGLNELILIWENDQVDGAVIPVDYDNIGRDDLLVLTDTNIWYVDDLFTNLGANITEYFVNPCLDSTWQVNTSVEVRITATDREGDLVNARAILYQGQTFEQDSNWTGNLSSGSTSSFSFTANETIGLATLRLITRDNNNPDLTDTIDLSFSVGSTGVEFGDCTTERDIGAEQDNETNVTIGPDLDSNIISQNADQIGALTGLGAGIIYLILMVVVAIGIWVYGGGSDNPQIIGGVIGFVELILLIIGVKLALVSFGVLLVIVVGAVVFIANIFRKNMTGA